MKIVKLYPLTDGKLKIVQHDTGKIVRRTVLALAVVEHTDGDQSVEMMVGADGRICFAHEVNFPPADNEYPPIPSLEFDGKDVTEWLGDYK